MLTVNSYPELFSTLLGWHQYQTLWDIIKTTGLAFVPFIAMIIKHTAEPFLSQSHKSAYLISLRRVEWSLATMILVIMVACQPLITLQPSVVHYQPICQPGVDATPGRSGTTYDDAFTNLPNVKVPLWWYGLMSLSNGTVAAATVGLGCTPNLREEQMQLQLTRITDAPLRAEVQEFAHTCWLNASHLYLQRKPDIQSYTQQYGSGDPSWLGSHAFLGMSGYYDSIKAPHPIVGFPFEQSRDWPQGKSHGQWGTPTCKAWWETPKIGLYDRLKAQIKPSLWNRWVADFGDDTAADEAIRHLVSTSTTSGYHDNTNLMEKATNGNYGGLFTGFSAGLGTFWHSFTYPAKMYTLIEVLPLIQAFLLLACYLFLAVALPASGYRFRTVVSLSFVIFSITFWSYLWQLAAYVDSAMIHALDPPGGWHKDGQVYGGASDTLMDMVAIFMYVGIPLFWSIFMGWAGIHAGNGATAFIDRSAAVSGGAGITPGGVMKTLPGKK